MKRVEATEPARGPVTEEGRPGVSEVQGVLLGAYRRRMICVKV